MAWNQPGNDGQDRDPWGSGNKGSNSGGNKGGRKPGAYDLDDLFRKIGSKLGGGGNKGGGEGNNKQSSPISGRLGILALAAVVVVW